MLLLGLALPAQAQIAFRGAASASNTSAGIQLRAVGAAVSTGNAANVVPGIPAGTQAGDLLILLIEAGDLNAISVSGGWTLLTNPPGTQGTTHQAAVYWKIAAAGETAPTVSRLNTVARNVLLAQIAGFINVDTANPFDGTPSFNASAGAVNTVTAGAITTGSACGVAIATAHIADNNAFTGITPGSWGQAFFSTTGQGNDAAIGLWSRVIDTPGAQPAVTVTHSANDFAHAAQFALRPGAAGSLTINVPAGTVAGDVMIATVASRPANTVLTNNNAVTICPPAGWTLVRDTINNAGGSTGGTGIRLQTWQRVAGAAEPANYSWFAQANNPSLPLGTTDINITGGIVSYSGVDNAAPVNVEGGNVTANSNSHTANGITTTVANTMLVASHAFLSSDTWTAPGGMSERVDRSAPVSPPANAVGVALLMSDELLTAAGATGIRTANASGAAGADSGAAHMLALRPAPALDHFSIFHSSSGVACDVHTITINAHNALHVPVSAGGLTVNLSTSNSRGTWLGIVAGGGTLSDPVPGDGAATYTFAAGSSSVQLSFRYANLALTAETFSFNVTGGGFSETTGTASQAGDDPNFTMAQAGFRFRNIEDNNSTILTQISGKPSNTGFNARTVRLQAIRTDNTTGSCTGLFASQSRSVDIGAECSNPAACAARQLSINGANIATSNDNGGAGANAYTAVSLVFNANSEADTVIAYPDAGLMTLHARFDLDADVAGFEMTGASNPFVVRPFGLRVSGVTTSAAPAPADPVFVKAGQDFNATLTAVLWKAGDDANADGVPDNDAQIAGNAATPNFGQEASAATALLTHTLNAPAGGAAGTLGGATTYTGFVTGGKTQAVNWSEVGFINLFAQSTNYLGGGQNVTNAATGLIGVGRFIPDHFIVTPGALTNRQGLACAPASTFTYEGEPFRVTFMLTARNALAAPTVTTNYATANTYARLDGAVPANFGFGAVDLADSTPPLSATALTTRLAPGTSSGTWLAGTGNFTADVTVNRAAAPDGPFESFRLGVLPVDLDNVTLRAAELDLDADVPANGNDRVSVGSTKIRFGRLRLGNISGSALLPLRMPMEAQYWNGTFFVTNTDDSCTAPAPANVGLGNAIGGITTSVTAVSALTSGRGTITLAPPAGGNRGSIDVAVNLGPVPPGTATADACPAAPAAFAPAATAANRAYLRGNWCNPPGTYTKDPSARARFGIARGSEETIYFRENF